MDKFVEPNSGEIRIHGLLAPILLRLFYTSFVEKLNLKGYENVLDYGSGPGICSKCIAERLPKGRLTCVDISSRWISEARHRLRNQANAQLVQGHVRDLNLPPDHYDLIVIHLVLHDIPQAERKNILNILLKSLKPGGKLIFREPLKLGHGIPAEEIHRLMTSCGLKRSSLTTPSIRFLGNVAEGIYQKEKKS